MEIFFGQAQLIIVVAIGLGIFCMKLDASKSLIDAVGALACCVLLLSLAGWVSLPTSTNPFTSVKSSISNLGCGSLAVGSQSRCQDASDTPKHTPTDVPGTEVAAQ